MVDGAHALRRLCNVSCSRAIAKRLSLEPDSSLAPRVVAALSAASSQVSSADDSTSIRPLPVSTDC
eukprot:scaffold81484_cov31-Tisochrysis_lutea.AAC.3